MPIPCGEENASLLLLASKPIWWPWQSLSTRDCHRHHVVNRAAVEIFNPISTPGLDFVYCLSHSPILCLSFPNCEVATAIPVLYILIHPAEIHHCVPALGFDSWGSHRVSPEDFLSISVSKQRQGNSISGKLQALDETIG